MQPVFDSNAPKKSTNLSINSQLLAEARHLKINLSAALERVLEQEVRESQRNKWLLENKQGIATCNELAEKQGLFSDKHRIF
jgi:antitoxin CcdA